MMLPMGRSLHRPALRALRELKGWSQEDLAVRAGTTKGYISKLETGVGGKAPTPAMVLRLADTLGVDITVITYPARPVCEHALADAS